MASEGRPSVLVHWRRPPGGLDGAPANPHLTDHMLSSKKTIFLQLIGGHGLVLLELLSLLQTARSGSP